jgi:conjugal transfer ATP-binding protein TraC
MSLFKKTLASFKDALLGQGQEPYSALSFTSSAAVKMQYERLCDWLPYTAYLQQNGLFLLEKKDGKGGDKPEALGFAFELYPLPTASQEHFNMLASMIQDAPTGSTMQLQVFACSDIREQLNNYINLRENPLFKEMAVQRAKYYEHATTTNILKSQPFLVRSYRVVLSCTAACEDLDNKTHIESIQRWKQRCEATLKSGHLLKSIWEPQEMIHWNNMLLNPQQLWRSESRPRVRYDPSKLLRSQMIDPGTALRASNAGDELLYTQANHPDIAVRCLSVRDYPNEFHFGNVSHLLGDIEEVTRQYPCPYLINIGWVKPDFESRKSKVNLQVAKATQEATNPIAKYMPAYGDKQRDWGILQDSYNRGKGEVAIYHQLVLFAEREAAMEAEEAAKNIWRTRGFTLSNDTFMGVQALLSVLPMSFTPAFAQDMKVLDRLSTKTVENAVHMSPVVAEWTGLGSAVLPLLGRRGQLGGVDLFANDEGNYNACVVGTSGSGKSVFSNELVSSYLGVGARAWIIDVGGSYKKLCAKLGGQYIEFGDSNQISLNPFPMIRNIEDDMEIVHPLIGQMASGLVGEGVSAYQYAAIGKAIRLAWEKHGVNTTVTILRDMLKDGRFEDTERYDHNIAEIATLLDKYAEGGAYGKYFIGEPNIAFNSTLIVLELEELKSKKDLQAVILLIMMYQITEEMYRGLRNQKKIVLIDEAWDLLNGGEAAAAFIEAGYRRARKYGGAFITATQGVDDYFKNPAATAAFANADWMFLLRSKPASIAAMKSSGRLPMTDDTQNMLETLRKVDGEFAEVFVMCPQGAAVFRCVIDPYTLLMYSSKGDDYETIQRLTQAGYTLDEAIRSILASRGQV